MENGRLPDKTMLVWRAVAFSLIIELHEPLTSGGAGGARDKVEGGSLVVFQSLVSLDELVEH